MKDAIDWDPAHEQLKSGKPVTMYVDSKSYDEKAYNSFAPISLNGFEETWSVQTVLPRSVILEPFARIVIFTLIAAAVMVILMGLVTAFFVYRQINPLTRVQKSMEMAASGDLTEQVDVSKLKQDEIGSVATSYNHMLSQTNEALSEVLSASLRLTESSAQVNHAFEEIVASSQEVSVATEEIAQGHRSNPKIQKKRVTVWEILLHRLRLFQHYLKIWMGCPVKQSNRHKSDLRKSIDCVNKTSWRIV